VALLGLLALAAAVTPANADHWSYAPGVPPPGANDPSCTSSEPPVILVHGTVADGTETWPI
jgi:hypothetical protein